MSIEHSFIEHRKYQEKILNIIETTVQEQRDNIILELDCGMGKRILQFLLVSKLFPESRFVILLHSTSSLEETKTFFTEKYKSGEDIQFISSRTPSYYRIKTLTESRVIGTTPQIFASTLQKIKKKQGQSAIQYDYIILNEVDKIVRRTARRRVVVFPYNQILRSIQDAIFIGMSGTIRDDHIYINQSQIDVVKDLKTLKDVLGTSTKVIAMEDILEDTDAENYLATSKLMYYPVFEINTVKLIQELDVRVKELREAILASLADEDTEMLKQLDQENIPWLTQYLPVNQDLKDAYTRLLLVRKYLSAMVPDQVKKFLWRVKDWIDPQLIVNLPKTNQKILQLKHIFQTYDKGVIICSYRRTASEIEDYLKKHRKQVLVITGSTRNKKTRLEEYAKWKTGILILTPVGERDLDITTGEVMVSFDSINTTKTMYQRFKRTREGDVISMFFKDTSEERKVKRLYKSIQNKYPWSIIVDYSN